MPNTDDEWFAFVLGFAAAILLIIAMMFAAGPHCPAEDSCYADYRDGAWHIIEDPDH